MLNKKFSDFSFYIHWNSYFIYLSYRWVLLTITWNQVTAIFYKSPPLETSTAFSKIENLGSVKDDYCSVSSEFRYFHLLHFSNLSGKIFYIFQLSFCFTQWHVETPKYFLFLNRFDFLAYTWWTLSTSKYYKISLLRFSGVTSRLFSYHFHIIDPIERFLHSSHRSTVPTHSWIYV